MPISLKVKIIENRVRRRTHLEGRSPDLAVARSVGNPRSGVATSSAAFLSNEVELNVLVLMLM